MPARTRRFRLTLERDVEKALRHAAIARDATTAAVIETALVELLMRAGWVKPSSERPAAPEGR